MLYGWKVVLQVGRKSWQAAYTAGITCGLRRGAPSPTLKPRPTSIVLTSAFSFTSYIIGMPRPTEYSITLLRLWSNLKAAAEFGVKCPEANSGRGGGLDL